MYFWNVSSLAKMLQNRALTRRQLFSYSVLLLMMLLTGINIGRFIPHFYRVSMAQVKNYIEYKVCPLPMSIVIFDDLDTFFLITLFALVGLGLFLCSKGPYKKLSWKDRFIAIISLAVPLSIRIMLFTGLLFGGIMLGFCLYFGWKLWFLAHQEPSSICARLFKPLIRSTRLLPFMNAVWHHGDMFCKIQTIFMQINACSYYLYYTAQITSLLSTFWFFVRMRDYLQKIDSKNA